MAKTKESKFDKTFIGGVLASAIIVVSMIAIVFIIDEPNVPQEYKDALASLEDYNQNGCSILDQTGKQEYFAKSKLEECFLLNNYSSEAKEYAWKKANIDFEAKAVRLIQDFIESMGRVGEKYFDNTNMSSYEAAKKATEMNKESLKSEWVKNYGYTEQQIDNAFEKVLGQ